MGNNTKGGENMESPRCQISYKLKGFFLKRKESRRICKEFYEELKAKETKEEKRERYIGYIVSAITSVACVLVLRYFGVI